jgi:uncharacterized membrane protein
VPRRPSQAQAIAWFAVGLVALFTLLGVVELWPSGQQVIEPPSGAQPKVESAKVVAVDRGGCRAGGNAPESAALAECRRVTVEITSGPDDGQVVGFDLGAGFDISEGDGLRVSASTIDLPEFAGVEVDPYSFSDFERRPALIVLGLVFVLLVVLTTRLKGVRALVALGASLIVILGFIVPAIADGNSPVMVALFGALAVMLLTISITHGVGVVASAAALGTAIALGVAVLVARTVIEAAHITGFAQEDATLLAAGSDSLSIQGLLIAGIVIGALGVLDDLTISQASTVMALRAASPSTGGRDLFRRALRVGEDHVVATINTLALAYAGAALPVLLIFSVAGTEVSEAINSEVVATEIVAAAAGGIALMIASPVTTGLATVLATQLADEDLEALDVPHTH